MRIASLALGLMMLVGCSSNANDAAETTTQDLATLPACQPLNLCEAPTWSFETRGWKHPVASRVVANLGHPYHRGRDMFYVPGEKQTVHAKFAYSLSDKDLHDEEIDVFVQRGCAGGWEKLGTSVTSHDGDHEMVDNVHDTGGRIYFEIPEAQRLPLGRHRVRTVVAGDGTFTDSFIDVIPRGTPIVVSDVDGTLTSWEHIEYVSILLGQTSQTHEGAPEALDLLASKGYRILYLTARPEILTGRTRDFLAERGFPPGLVHTSPNTLGAVQGEGGAAVFKTNDLATLRARGLTVSYGFGNKTTDAEAYGTAIANPQNRVLFQLDDAFVGRGIESYTELHAELSQLEDVCR